MMSTTRRFFFPALLAASAAGMAAAQATKIVPPSAAKGDANTATPYFSGYGSGRVQQVVDGAAIATTGAALLEVRLRADGARPGALAGRSFARLDLTVGYTSRLPGTLSTRWAANRTGPQTVVLSGPYNLPAQAAGSRPFNIPFKFKTPFAYLRSKGNLLLEWVVPGRPSKTLYFFDAHQATGSGGSVRFFGTGGLLSGTTRYALTAQASTLQRGGVLSAGVQVKPPRAFSATMLVGVSNRRFGAFLLPFSLASLGAPGNFLNVSPDVLVPFSISGAIGRGGIRASIPDNPWLAGKTVYVQAVIADRAANALGMVFSVGGALGIGAGSGSPVQMVAHYDSTAQSGLLLRRTTGIVLMLVGAFS